MSDFQIPFLSSLVGILAEVMRVCLEFCYKMTEDLGFPSYGIAIIVLTVIIKTLLLPLALKQIRSMKAMPVSYTHLRASRRGQVSRMPSSA